MTKVDKLYGWEGSLQNNLPKDSFRFARGGGNAEASCAEREVGNRTRQAEEMRGQVRVFVSERSVEFSRSVHTQNQCVIVFLCFHETEMVLMRLFA